MSRREERDDDLGAVESGRGRAVGKYQLLAVLGRGGMADVFLALSRGPMGFQASSWSPQAPAPRARRGQGLPRDVPRRRRGLAARLNHPNVVHTHEVGEDEGIYFIAMEYLEGQSLNKIIRELSKRDEILPPLLCARIISDALAGLHYAHELKDFDGTPLSIIHRDVSPHNVFVTYDGSVKMVDFGIAKAALSSVQTEVGVLKGKVAYMSPEQAAGGAIDPRADVFAMGIVLWELLAQERLMTGDSAAATLHRLLSAPIPRITSLRPDVSPALEGSSRAPSEKDPSRRFASALDMRGDALGGTASRPAAARSARRRSGARSRASSADDRSRHPGSRSRPTWRGRRLPRARACPASTRSRLTDRSAGPSCPRGSSPCSGSAAGAGAAWSPGTRAPAAATGLQRSPRRHRPSSAWSRPSAASRSGWCSRPSWGSSPSWRSRMGKSNAEAGPRPPRP